MDPHRRCSACGRIPGLMMSSGLLLIVSGVPAMLFLCPFLYCACQARLREAVAASAAMALATALIGGLLTVIGTQLHRRRGRREEAASDLRQGPQP